MNCTNPNVKFRTNLNQQSVLSCFRFTYYLWLNVEKQYFKQEQQERMKETRLPEKLFIGLNNLMQTLPGLILSIKHKFI